MAVNIIASKNSPVHWLALQRSNFKLDVFGQHGGFDIHKLPPQCSTSFSQADGTCTKHAEYERLHDHTNITDSCFNEDVGWHYSKTAKAQIKTYPFTHNHLLVWVLFDSPLVKVNLKSEALHELISTSRCCWSQQYWSRRTSTPPRHVQCCHLRRIRIW